MDHRFLSKRPPKSQSSMRRDQLIGRADGHHPEISNGDDPTPE